MAIRLHSRTAVNGLLMKLAASGILVVSSLRKLWMKTPRRRAFVVSVLFVLLVIAALATVVLVQAHRAVQRAQREVADANNLPFAVRQYVPPTNPGFEWLSTPALFSQAAEFQGHLYVAGQTGLFEYDEGGHKQREFRVGQELPPSPLLQLAKGTLTDSQQPELLIATAAAGVLAFDGANFRQILPQTPDARAITSILPLPSGHLLIGTAKRGVLVYDGRHLTSFHPSLADAHVTVVAGSDTDLWIGTQDRGVAHWHGGTAEWFGESGGLPDPAVYALTISGDRTYIGTADGIAEFRDGKFFRPMAAGAFVRSLLVSGKSLLAGTMDDGVLEIPLHQSSRPQPHSVISGKLMEVEQLFQSGSSTYALTRQGVYARNRTASWNRVLASDSRLLTDGNVSALGADNRGRLWIGYFDHGLDIVSNSSAPGAGRTRHIEDDQLFCINRILANTKTDVTGVATANGLVLFDNDAIERQVLTRDQGLIADHVTDVAPYGDGMVVATPAGLTFMDSAGMRSIYAFHGLVNNHVYALAADGEHLLAGTLGGVTLLDGDEVRASYTTATSSLKHNWITAAIHVGDEWWVGTYGAGVMRMNDREPGRFESAAGIHANVVVNPGAMLATDRLILAGTMGHGLFVMDRNSERWSLITDGLPSLNVTALTAAHGQIYVGTDNGLVRIEEARLLP